MFLILCSMKLEVKQDENTNCILQSSFSLRTGEEKEDPNNEICIWSLLKMLHLDNMTNVRQTKILWKRQNYIVKMPAIVPVTARSSLAQI